MTASRILQTIVARNRRGEQRGIPSWCTANPQTLRAILDAYRDDDDPILIEATCNQVDEFGRYAGMTPAAFRRFVEGRRQSRPTLIPGESLLAAIIWDPIRGRTGRLPKPCGEACEMVKAYVETGFAKIHLDASMACAGEAGLAAPTIAERAAGTLRGRRNDGCERASTWPMSSAPRSLCRAAKPRRSTRWR